MIALLALLLPGATAALAQEPLPEKTIPATNETPGESFSPPATLAESEANNSFATADPIALGDVISGKIRPAGDIDYFTFNATFGDRVLIDVDAQANGSALDPVICVYDSYQYEIACNDDSDGLDSLLFLYVAGAEPPFYVKVQELNHPHEGGAAYTYRLAVYTPLFVSATTAGTVQGVPFEAADILAHYDFPGGEKWLLFFDASDVKISQNMNSFTIGEVYEGAIAMSFQGNQPIPTTEFTATPHDVVRFAPFNLGPTTSGSFINWTVYALRGREIGLTTSSEKIDAIAQYDYMYMTVSTTGTAEVPYSWPPPAAIRGRDEDLLSAEVYYGVAEDFWDQVFDGSTVAGLAGEDIIAAAYDAPNNVWYLTILGSGVLAGQPFNQQDIFMVQDGALLGRYWNAAAHHFPYTLDAIEIGFGGTW
jgi:hypothetical protein